MPKFGCDFLPQSNTVHSFQNSILDQKCSGSAETAAGSYISEEAQKALRGSLKPCVQEGSLYSTPFTAFFVCRFFVFLMMTIPTDVVLICISLNNL